MCGTWSITFQRQETSSSYSKDAPVLVKVLLNEHEATLPVETDKFPYYEWNKVREFYLDILENSPIKERFQDR